MRDEGLPATSIGSLLLELDRAQHGGGDGGLAQGSVLLIDEAGMVDSATLARLVSHAERAEAKLVLIGDPEQLGEVEAGGLFRAVADRTEPIHLDEVIRHEHDLDREAAKRIREGEGREALALYQSSERVTVFPDAEARREAMVCDWLEAFERGEDAVMIAKRNVEVAKLNAMAREVRGQEGKLGVQEIEVGEARFAAGDQVITRVNDRQADIYNRERWRITEVDAEQRRVVLEGIDRAKRVEIGAEYLARTDPHSDAPALEHAYAVTTYSAQGATVDRAYVMADPSMDKQELYVAASRSRKETHLYATPEIQTHREEIAPRSPYLREAIPHIAEAAERDRAQLAAHDVAQLEALPTSELIKRREELRVAVGGEAKAERQLQRLQEQIEVAQRRVERHDRERESAQELNRRFRKDELAHIDGEEAKSLQRLSGLKAEAREFPVPSGSARCELAIADHVLAERRQLAITAAGVAPPPYITKELGERPSDPVKRKAWEHGVEGIETYRQQFGVKDRGRAFGSEPRRAAERAAREAQLRRLREMQRKLGRQAGIARTREMRRGLGIAR
jgi:hypothetical protein